MLMGLVNSQCFTMPPKVMPVSAWAISIPNVNSPSFIHQSHPCPNSYELHSQYSHIESLVIITILNVKISSLNIYGYSVCCITNKYDEIIITYPKNVSYNYLYTLEDLK